MKTSRSYLIRGINILFIVLIVIVFFKLRESVQYEREKAEQEGTVVFVTENILPSTPRIIKVAKGKVSTKKKVTTKIVNQIDTSNNEVLATYTGNISHYASDCSGCNGVTASGFDLRSGDIYYQDPTYGTVKIVAGDKSFPFGTIIRITSSNSSQLAIVLDRGGAIGFRGRYLFDMVCQSEAQSYKLGVIHNAQVDVLRYGY